MQTCCSHKTNAKPPPLCFFRPLRAVVYHSSETLLQDGPRPPRHLDGPFVSHRGSCNVFPSLCSLGSRVWAASKAADMACLILLPEISSETIVPCPLWLASLQGIQKSDWKCSTLSRRNALSCNYTFISASMAGLSVFVLSSTHSFWSPFIGHLLYAPALISELKCSPHSPEELHLVRRTANLEVTV